MIIILSAPSGAGKTSITKKLLELDSNLTLSISVTTREKRVGEVEGVDYFFTDKPSFSKMVDGGKFLEYTEMYNNMYGTPKAYVEEQILNKKDVLFDIDSKGAYQILDSVNSKVVSIFILPPSLEELEKRLKLRNQDDAKNIDKRLSFAKDEMLHSSNYDYVVINDNFDNTIKEITSIINLERKFK